MRYRLGEFQARSGSSDYALLLDDPEFKEPMSKALEQMLQVRLSRSSAQRGLPDLLPEVPPGHADEPWVRSVHEGLEVLSESLEVRLLACEFEPGPNGFLCIAATSPSVAGEVRPEDWVQAGMAALRDGDHPVRISRRIFRPVCDNGSIVSVREFDDVMTRSAGVEAAVSLCFDRAEFGNSLEALREAAGLSIPDPRPMLDEMDYLDSRSLEEIMRRWWGLEPKTKTLWDLINHVTDVARDLPNWGDRFDLEEEAGRLAKLRRPVPRLSPGKALTLTGT
jgi:hypothetical protein